MLTLTPRKRLPRGPGFKMERVIEAHNGRGLGKPVPLYNHKTQTAPELLEPGVEGRAADYKAEELQMPNSRWTLR